MLDLPYLLFQIEEWYFDHVAWRIDHYLRRQRCENCRNWNFCGSPNGRPMGECVLNRSYWEDYHNWCPVWNMDFAAEEKGYTRCEDGWIRVETTLTGKKIVQESKSGIWVYKKDYVEGEEVY